MTTTEPSAAVAEAITAREPRRSASARAIERVGAEGAPLAVLAALVLAYVIVFGWLTYQQQRNYGTFGFDMGIHDQGIWLLSRFKDPYVTVVGRDYLGHHLNLIAFFYVPFYWLGAGPAFLYFTETVALALGAVPVYLLARDQLGNKWLGTAFAAAYLLNPTIQWINWWHYHPDALMVTPLLFAWWFATRRQWLAFGICSLLAMFAKEDATTAVVMMGVILLVRNWRTDKRIGLFTIAGGVGWFVIATKLLMPHFNHGELAFYEDFFPGLGNGLGDIVKNAIRHPSRLYDPLLGRTTSGRPGDPSRTDPAQVEAFRDSIYRYYRQLLLPMCIVALRKPTLLLIGVPMLVINVMSSLSYTHDAKYHYSAIIVVAVVLASIEGAKALGRKEHEYTVIAVGAVLAFALVANVSFSPSPLDDRTHHTGVWARPWLASEPVLTSARDHMVALVPSDAGVSATYSLVPHLTHRETVYEFPNPWWITNWLDCKTAPQPDRVDMLVVDTAVLSTGDDFRFEMSPKELFETLTKPDGGEFSILAEEGGVVVAERVRPALLSFETPRPKCE